MSIEILIEYELQFRDELNQCVEDAVYSSEPEKVTDYLVNWWSGHKTEYHDKLSNYLN